MCRCKSKSFRIGYVTTCTIEFIKWGFYKCKCWCKCGKKHSHEVPYPTIEVEIHIVQPQNFTIEVEGEEPFKLHEEIIIVMQLEEHKLEFDEYVIIGTIFTTVVIDNNGQS